LTECQILKFSEPAATDKLAKSNALYTSFAGCEAPAIGPRPEIFGSLVNESTPDMETGGLDAAQREPPPAFAIGSSRYGAHS
jgi:hypothetical protein